MDDLADPIATEYALGPATRLLWRSPRAVHLELGNRAVVVDGLPNEIVRRIVTPRHPAGPAPAVPEPIRATLTGLAEQGYLWPRSSAGPDPRLAPPEPRLAGELTALAIGHGIHAAEVLRTRRRATVRITGRSRVGPQLAALLAAGGVGRVHCALDGSTRLHHLVPGGATDRDEGEPLSAAAEAAVRRAAPATDTTPLLPDEQPDLTVLATDAPVPDERVDALHAAGAAHLVVRLAPDTGTVGPLVLPGLTSCLRCADLHRRDRDPAWPALAVQLAIPGRYGAGSEVAVVTVLAGLAAQQALAFLDGGEPACVDGTLEFGLGDWRVRRRSWAPHPDCVCCVQDDARPPAPGWSQPHSAQ